MNLRITTQTIVATLAALLFVPLSTLAQKQTPRCAPGNEVTINFDELIQGSPLSPGASVTNQYAQQGVLVSATASGLPTVTAPIIFDSSCGGSSDPSDCSGGDRDLGSPNQDFGGPGEGSGGATTGAGPNTEAQNNILIIPEDVVDGDNDGLVDDPDDNAGGGVISFSFSAPVEIASLKFLDVETISALGEKIEIEGLKADNSNAFTTLEAQPLGNNSFQEIVVPQHGTTVTTLNLIFDDTSGSVLELKYCREICVPDACGICNGPGTDDCGLCPGDSGYGTGPDECDLCPGDSGFGLGKDDCELCPSEPLYEDAKDDCGICFGDNSLCADCLDQPNGDAIIDECGECVPPEDAGQSIDACGVCFGGAVDPSECVVTPTETPTNPIECAEVDITSTLFALDGLAFEQFQVNKKLIRNFRRQSGKKNAFANELTRSEELYIENWNLTWQGGTNVLTDCNSIFCTSISSEPTTVTYSANSSELDSIGQSVVKRTRRKVGNSRKVTRLNKKRKRLATEDEALLASLPAETFACRELFD